MKTNIKQKFENSKVNFSGSLFKSIIIPLAIGVLALVFTFVLGFNRGMDFKGGIIVSFDAGVSGSLSPPTSLPIKFIYSLTQMGLTSRNRFLLIS